MFVAWRIVGLASVGICFEQPLNQKNVLPPSIYNTRRSSTSAPLVCPFRALASFVRETIEATRVVERQLQTEYVLVVYLPFQLDQASHPSPCRCHLDHRVLSHLQNLFVAIGTRLNMAVGCLETDKGNPNGLYVWGAHSYTRVCERPPIYFVLLFRMQYNRHTKNGWLCSSWLLYKQARTRKPKQWKRYTTKIVSLITCKLFRVETLVGKSASWLHETSRICRVCFGALSTRGGMGVDKTRQH